jgi:hypothetical protein
MLTQIQSGFYALINACTTNTYNTIAPASSVLPYITFGLNSEVPIGDFEDFEGVENLTYWVNCFSSKSIAECCSLADEVMGKLDDGVVSASGFTTMKLVREFIGNIIYDQETGVWQQPLRFRLWLDKT